MYMYMWPMILCRLQMQRCSEGCGFGSHIQDIYMYMTKNNGDKLNKARQHNNTTRSLSLLFMYMCVKFLFVC